MTSFLPLFSTANTYRRENKCDMPSSFARLMLLRVIALKNLSSQERQKFVVLIAYCCKVFCSRDNGMRLRIAFTPKDNRLSHNFHRQSMVYSFESLFYANYKENQIIDCDDSV